MKSNMPPQQDFSKVLTGQLNRSIFNRTHTHKTTFNKDELIPFMVDEIYPGDSMEVTSNIFARLSSTLDFPIMDNMHLDTHYFFCPWRIVWKDMTGTDGSWEKFMGQQIDPGDSIDFAVPQMVESGGGQAVQSLMDYMGIPPGFDFSVSALYARAYVKTYNQWFRDELLQDSITEHVGDGPDAMTNYQILKRGKRHDYFTSCLPTPQKGDAVEIGLSGMAPVYGDGNAITIEDNTGGDFGLFADGTTNAWRGNSGIAGDPIGTDVSGGSNTASTDAMGLTTNTAISSGMQAHLDSATAISINDLRLAVATQQLLELDNRGGTRYFEILKAHFGISSPDSRLQRVEYLGGSTKMINVNLVTQTSESNDTDKLYQGHQAGFVTASSASGFKKAFVEHGCVLGILSVRADLTYQQGINRMFMRSDRYDFYFPTFANLGEQAVLNQEIWYQDASADEDVFGYNERWSELRYKPSLITGRFRSDAASTLDAWHLSQDFGTLPVLNSAFITENMPLDRILTVPGTATVPHFIMDSYIQVEHARVLPTYSTPGLKRL